MTTKAGFRGGAKAGSAKNAAPRKPAATVPTTVPKVRRVASQDEAFARSLAGKHDDGIVELPQEDLVDVNVPANFKLTDDNHIVHEYTAGEQKMRKSHAAHWYTVANGVKVLD